MDLEKTAYLAPCSQSPVKTIDLLYLPHVWKGTQRGDHWMV